jgi:hypothetical protein
LAATGALIAETAISIIFPDLFSPEKLYLLGNIIPILVLAIIEEIFILLMVQKILYDIGRTRQGFLLSFVCGGGFAFFELALRLFGDSTEKLISAPHMGIFIIHIFTSGFFGYFLARKEQGLIYKVVLLLVASLIHFVYNYLIVLHS